MKKNILSNMKILVGCLALVILTTACASGPKVQQGSVIKFHYVGTLKDGSQFDATAENRPLVVLIGSGQVLPSFEKKILGMHKGQTRKFSIKAKDAYGEPDPKKIATLPRDDRFKGIELKEGAIIYANTKQADGKVIQNPMKITKLTDTEVTLDYNHPLAGKDLTFKVTLVDLINPQDQAKAGAQPASAPVAPGSDVQAQVKVVDPSQAKPESAPAQH